MSERCKAMSLDPSMSSLPDFLANLIQWLVSGKQVQMTGMYGLKLGASSARLTPGGLWERTFRGFSQARLDGFSVESFPTWSRLGIVWDGQYTALTRSERHTGASDFSLWPTPTASNPNEGEPLSSWQARRARIRAERKN